MKPIVSIALSVVVCIAIQGCRGAVQAPHVVEETESPKENARPVPPNVTEAKARQLATDHVNSTFRRHVWKTALGDRAFYCITPQQWHSIATKDGRLLLKYGYGSRGQDFTVSMNPDGTEIKVEHHGYALR